MTAQEDPPLLCSLSTKLAPGDLAAITALEKVLESPLLAFKCHDVRPAAVSAAQLTKIQDLEKNSAWPWWRSGGKAALTTETRRTQRSTKEIY